MQPQRFTTALEAVPRGGVRVSVPFDPNAIWTPKPRHHVNGSINGVNIRGVLEPAADGQYGLTLGPAWLRACAALTVGQLVVVQLAPEGPQRTDLAPDIADALDASPAAAAFFDSLAQFYRKAYLRWIDGTKRRPDERARRIRELITLLEAGLKQRPGA